MSRKTTIVIDSADRSVVEITTDDHLILKRLKKSGVEIEKGETVTVDARHVLIRKVPNKPYISDERRQELSERMKNIRAVQLGRV